MHCNENIEGMKAKMRYDLYICRDSIFDIFVVFISGTDFYIYTTKWFDLLGIVLYIDSIQTQDCCVLQGAQCRRFFCHFFSVFFSHYFILCFCCM